MVDAPKVEQISAPYDQKDVCQLPASELRELGWKGYREKRAAMRNQDPKTCLKHAKWVVDGRRLCSQHAGMAVLKALSSHEHKSEQH